MDKKNRMSWPDIMSKIGNYKPMIYYRSCTWKPPDSRRIKCNTDGASRERNVQDVLIETDSRGLKKIIQKEWKVPWELVERMEEIRDIMLLTVTIITHTYKEGYGLADCIANISIEGQTSHEYHSFHELAVRARQVLNTEKAKVPVLHKKTSKINHQ
ncbi:hypothetical protein H5410_061776 [Solanum commersonii]|uniref:RNase H family protein n=1 Tax=Solanum commersonii TaxID=4109 RepID=A0A9J5W8Y5_SOLCO|nr:hypothetical protein H5410_061776 [Solanum commersonii]